MKHTHAVFSVKFNPVLQIRDYGKEIEKILSDLYLPLNILPVPESVFCEVPRMVAESKYRHSQISMSQLSIDVVSNFDDEYSLNFEKIEGYVKERALLVKKILEVIGVNEYLYMGLIDNIELDIQNSSSVSFMKKFLSQSFVEKELHEITLRVSKKEDKYFINKQYATFEQYNINTPSQSLLSFKGRENQKKGVALSLDINNRFDFLYNGNLQGISSFESEISNIFSLLKEELDGEKNNENK